MERAPSMRTQPQVRHSPESHTSGGQPKMEEGHDANVTRSSHERMAAECGRCQCHAILPQLGASSPLF